MKRKVETEFVIRTVLDTIMKLFTPCPIEFQALFHGQEIRSKSPSICTIIVARQQDIYRLSYYVQVALQYARMRVVGDVQWYYGTGIGMIRMARCLYF